MTANTKDVKATPNRKSLILFAAFPVGYWFLTLIAFLLPGPQMLLFLVRFFFGATSFVLAYYVANRTSDTSLSDHERWLFRVICFVAISPPLGMLIR